MSVCVIVRTLGSEEDSTALHAAVASQTRPPDQQIAAGPGGDRVEAFNRALRGALAGAAQWLWLIDCGVVPEPSALERLLAPLAAVPELPTPVLLAGRVTAPDGRLHPLSAPWPRLTRKDVAVVACEHRLLSIRAARHGSVLVHRRAVERSGLPASRYLPGSDDLEWTARILKDAVGYLVPDSVATRRAHETAGVRTHLRHLRGRLKMLCGSTLQGEERLLYVQMSAQDALAEMRARPRVRAPSSTVG